MGSAEPPGDDVAGSLSSYKKFEKSLASKSSKKMVILIREFTKTEEEDKKRFFCEIAQNGKMNKWCRVQHINEISQKFLPKKVWIFEIHREMEYFPPQFKFQVGSQMPLRKIYTY